MKTSWLYVALFAVGCGGSSVTVDQYAAEQIKIQCEFEVKCCKTVANAVVYTDVTSCETEQTAAKATVRADVKARIAAGTIRFSASAADHCNSLTRTLASICSNMINESTDTSACDNVFVGTIAIGAACGSDDSGCVPGADCVNSVCKKFLAAGEICSNTDNTTYPSCAHGLQCDYNISHTCITPKADGAACTDGAECKSYDCESGKCVPTTPEPVTYLCQAMPQP